MNFPLQKLELHVDEPSFLKGEQLYEAGRVIDLAEIEKHLWLGKVKDNDVLEVEVKISPSKVKAASCECSIFHQNGMCEHIVSVLLDLRKKRQFIKDQKEKKKPAKPRKRKLTTGLVLNDVNPEDLNDFVRDYAKRNRNFAIALKARFASSVSTIQGKEKYLQLLESTIGAARKPNRSISIRGVQKIRKVVDELLYQLEEKLVDNYLTEALGMAQSIIEKITPAISKAENKEEELLDRVNQAFRAIQRILELNAPPSLKDQIWEYSLEECNKFIYRNSKIDQHFYQILETLADGPKRMQVLLDLIDELEEKYAGENRNAAPLLLFRLRVLEKSDDPDSIQELINDYLMEPEVLKYALNRAHARGNFQRAKMLALHGLARHEQAKFNYELQEILLEIAIKEQDTPNILKFAEKRFLTSLRFSYYQLLKKHTTKGWEKKVDQLIEAINQKSYSLERRDAIAQIYVEEGKTVPLLNYLKKMNSIDLLLRFDQYLLAEQQEELFTIYSDTLRYYLNNHLGRKPSVRIREVLTHLQEIGAHSLTESLVEEFRASYPERHSLQEELEVF